MAGRALDEEFAGRMAALNLKQTSLRPRRHVVEKTLGYIRQVAASCFVDRLAGKDWRHGSDDACLVPDI